MAKTLHCLLEISMTAGAIKLPHCATPFFRGIVLNSDLLYRIDKLVVNRRNSEKPMDFTESGIKPVKSMSLYAPSCIKRAGLYFDHCFYKVRLIVDRFLICLLGMLQIKLMSHDAFHINRTA